MKHLIVFALLCAACATLSPAAAPSSQLGELTRRRDDAISRLHEYREKGVFPTSADGMPLSVFRDAHGVRCPMAQLIHDSGRDDLVNAVVARNNELRLADVHEGPLYDWMLHSGLTLDEIAMVQGALQDDVMSRFRFIENPRMELVAAHARVAGRLEMAETALRNATPHILASIAALADAPHVSTGPVVPHDAIASAAR
jgi:hypothetical protein